MENVTKTYERDVSKIYTAIHNAMEDVSYIQKQSAAGVTYTIKTEQAFMEAIRPVLVKHGIVVHPSRAEVMSSSSYEKVNKYNKVTVWHKVLIGMTFRFAHKESGNWIDVASFGEGHDFGDKAIYKAMTGAKKYALAHALMIITGDDPDLQSSDEQKVEYEKPSAKAIIWVDQHKDQGRLIADHLGSWNKDEIYTFVLSLGIEEATDTDVAIAIAKLVASRSK
jgi:hypothetical protein